MGRCGAPDLHAGRQGLHRALLHRRHAARMSTACTDFEKYRVDRHAELAPDFFVPDFDPAAARRDARRPHALVHRPAAAVARARRAGQHGQPWAPRPGRRTLIKAPSSGRLKVREDDGTSTSRSPASASAAAIACPCGARSTRGSGSFTRGPFLLIDLETEGRRGRPRRCASPSFRLARRCVPILLEELVATRQGPQDRLRRCAGGARCLPEASDAPGPRGPRARWRSPCSTWRSTMRSRARPAVPLYQLLGGTAEPLPTYQQLRTRHRRAAGGGARSQARWWASTAASRT